jgi:ribonucleoside-diphosphate reductase beta chain
MEKLSVFNHRHVDFLEQPMFFGESLNVARYDVQKYPIFEKLTETQHGFFWRPQEVSLLKDKSDFKLLTKNEKFIFTANIKYQTLLDSIQERAPLVALLPHVSIPELEGVIITWSFFEHIHSRSYAHILRNLVPNPAEFFDEIVVDPNIVARAEMVGHYYDDFLRYGSWFKMLGVGTHTINGETIEINMRELKKKLYLALISINILEGIRFYASFACSFAFAKLKKMEGNAKIIEFIARDEFQHLAVTQNIIKNFQRKEDDQEMIQLMAECENEVLAMFDAAVQQEKDWAEYLFKDGSIIGLNAKLLSSYIEFIGNQRLRTLGFSQRYDTHANPLNWINEFLDSSSKQVAPQETEIKSYVVGQIDQNIADEDFENITL